MTPQFWAKPKFVALVILLYLAVHLAIRMAMGPALSADDSEQALLSQEYAWAYRYKAPPLFNWLLTTLSYVLPVDRFSIGLLRYTLLGVLYAFIYLAARQLLSDRRLAALSVYSFAAINPFAEASHRNLTHSTTLTAVTAVTWYMFLRLAASPRLPWYLAVGAACGFGMLAKWNFVLLALALPLACLLSQEHRHLVLTWRIIPAGLLAAAIVLPTVIATLHLKAPTEEEVATILNIGANWSLGDAARGTLNLIDAALVYSLPFLPIVAVLFAPSLWRGARVLIAEDPPDRAIPSARLLGLSMAVGLALLWLLVVVGGATEFKVRYLYPVLLILPVWTFLIIEAGRPSERPIRLFALVLAALAIFVAGKRVAPVTGWMSCGVCAEWSPYGRLAKQLVEAGFKGDGTVLTDLGTGGNMRVEFPRARILDPTYPARSPIASPDPGQCLILFGGDGEVHGERHQLASLERYLVQTLEGRADAPYREGVVVAPMLAPATGTLQYSYRLYNDPNGDCR